MGRYLVNYCDALHYKIKNILKQRIDYYYRALAHINKYRMIVKSIHSESKTYNHV